jgi:hypothetical protein
LEIAPALVPTPQQNDSGAQNQVKIWLISLNSGKGHFDFSFFSSCDQLRRWWKSFRADLKNAKGHLRISVTLTTNSRIYRKVTRSLGLVRLENYFNSSGWFYSHMKSS